MNKKTKPKLYYGNAPLLPTTDISLLNVDDDEVIFENPINKQFSFDFNIEATKLKLERIKKMFKKQRIPRKEKKAIKKFVALVRGVDADKIIYNKFGQFVYECKGRKFIL